jgi:hypothetical protein
MNVDNMNAVRVPWSSASFLVYLGGLTILAAILGLLAVQSSEHGAGGFVFWALVIFALFAVAAWVARLSGYLVTAGLLTLSAVTSFVVFLGAILDWFGWLADFTEPLRGFHVSFLFLELVFLVASGVALSIYRFPPLAFFVAAGSWFFVADFLSNGGDWTAILSIAIGLVLLLAAVAVDEGPSKPFAFWLHIASGIAIGGALLWFFHESDFDFIVIAVVGLAYIALGDRLQRSSWVVIGAWGILQTASHYADKWSDVTGAFFPFFPLFPFVAFSGFDGVEEVHEHQWLGPFVFVITGAFLMAIALWLAHRRREAIADAELL